MKLLQAIRARDAAKDKLAAAKTAKARTEALADLDKKSMALARAQVAAGVRADEDEPKKPLAEEEEDEEEEKDSDSDDDSAEEEKDEEESMDDSDSSSDSDDSEEEEKEEEDKAEEEDSMEEEEEKATEEEEKKAKAAALSSARALRSAAKKSGDKKLLALAKKNVEDAKKALATPKSLASLKQFKSTVQKVTGKKSSKEALGAIQGLSALPAQVQKLSASAAKSKLRERKERVEKLLTENRGRYASTEKDQLRETAMKLGTKWLKANLTARPKNIRTLKDGVMEGKSYSEKPPQKKGEKEFDLATMNAEQQKLVETAAANAGISPAEYVAQMNDPNPQHRKPAGKKTG